MLKPTCFHATQLIVIKFSKINLFDTIVCDDHCCIRIQFISNPKFYDHFTFTYVRNHSQLGCPPETGTPSSKYTYASDGYEFLGSLFYLREISFGQMFLKYFPFRDLCSFLYFQPITFKIEQPGGPWIPGTNKNILKFKLKIFLSSFLKSSRVFS